MYAMDAVKEAAENKGIALRQIGLTLGKSAQYVTAIVTQGSTPKADTLARLLDVCGYGLYAIPYGSEPDNAIQITDMGQGENTGDK